MAPEQTFEKTFVFDDINPLDFFGPANKKLKQIQEAYPEVKFIARGNRLKTLGKEAALVELEELIERILNEIRKYGPPDRIRLSELLRATDGDHPDKRPLVKMEGNEIFRGPNGLSIRARTPGQLEMVAAAAKNDVVFAIGPAGTGKTYTAVAIAVNALKQKLIKKIVLVRPAVEAGESLGFLPGDLKEKIDPYLRPLYDALEDMILPEKLNLYLEQNVIEIVPLAYMRGRTLNNAFVILDEAQNATELQLRMFLTRMGNESKIFVTGDHSQVDLPKHQRSGLVQGMRILEGIKGIAFVRLSAEDVVRHPIVKRILAAYEKEDEGDPERNAPPPKRTPKN